ncbi:MAG: gluconate 5-dehydrogenase [bacterium]
MFNLKGKIALITGTGKESIGYGIAKGLANAGATIVFNTFSLDSKNRALDQYKQDGIKAYGYVFDVTNENEVISSIKHIEANIGEIDILVNNAGIIKRTPMHEMEVTDFNHVVNVDLIGPFIMAKAVLPSMMKKRSGKIINICSMMSEFGRETVSAYAAAKGGLKMLTKNIASEYGEYNIQCNGIGPGYISTPLTEPLRTKQEDGADHPFDKFIKSKTPMGRWGNPEDLMGPAIFLSSSASDFVNGQIIYVDGGLSSYIGKQVK